MPTTVKAHNARRGKTTYRVRRYVRNGPEHSAAWKRCVTEVSRDNPNVNPFAVCTAAIGPKSRIPRGGRGR